MVSQFHSLYLNDYVSLVKQHVTTFLGSPEWGGGVKAPLPPIRLCRDRSILYGRNNIDTCSTSPMIAPSTVTVVGT